MTRKIQFFLCEEDEKRLLNEMGSRNLSGYNINECARMLLEEKLKDLQTLQQKEFDQ